MSFNRANLTAIVVLGVCVNAAVAAAQAVPIGPPVAAVPIQLPTVRVVSVQTTVSAPDGGTAVLGGLSRSAAYRNGSAQAAGFGQEFANSQVSARATIIDFEEIDQGVSLRVANRLLAEGDLASAIERLLDLQQAARSPQLRRESGELLATLKERAREELAQIASEPPSTEAWERLNRLADRYGAVMDASQWWQQRQRIAGNRAVAQALRGSRADQYLSQAQQLEATGKANVAAVYYRMAAGQQGTDAARLAQEALSHLQPKNALPVVHAPATEPDYARLAALYRDINPAKAQQFAEKARQTRSKRE